MVSLIAGIFRISATGLHSVHYRHHHIQDDELWLVLLGQLQRLGYRFWLSGPDNLPVPGY